MSCEIPAQVEAYLELVESDQPRACPEQHALAAYVRRVFAQEDIRVDTEQLGHYLGLAKYFPFQELFPWEEFVLALWDCTYRADGAPRWKTLLAMVGRGAGKDGLIAFDGADFTWVWPVEGDLRQVSSLLPAGGMDWAVANPPYFPVGSGPVGRRAQARREDTLSLEELCRAAAWLLKWGGGFTLVHRPERLAEVMWQLKTCGLEPKRLKLLRHQAQKPVSLLLVEAKKGAAPGLLLEPDLILRDEAGRETAQCRALYHRDGKECD